MRPPELPPLPPDIAALIARDVRTRALDAASSEAILARVQSSLGAPLGSPTDPPPAPIVAPARPSGVFALAKSGAAIVVVATGAWLGRSILESRHPAPANSARAAIPVAAPAAVPRVVPPVAATSAPVAPIEAPAAPAAALLAPTEQHAATHSHRLPTAELAPSSLGAERALLDAARGALARRDGQAAADALSRHAARYPDGILSEERESMWIAALILGGQNDAAQARAARFARRYPHSMFGPAVRATLQSRQ